jgi:hypothetical protein
MDAGISFALNEPRALASVIVVFHKGAQAGQPLVPLRGDLVETVARYRKLLSAYLPLPIPPRPITADEAGVFKHM